MAVTIPLWVFFLGCFTFGVLIGGILSFLLGMSLHNRSVKAAARAKVRTVRDDEQAMADYAAYLIAKEQEAR